MRAEVEASELKPQEPQLPAAAAALAEEAVVAERDAARAAALISTFP